MSIKLFNEDGTIIIRSVSDSNVIDHVPPAVYRLRQHPLTGEVFLLKDREKFDVPAKCYGRHNVNKEAILGAWRKSTGSTGAILHGIKGAGKSILAEDLGNSVLKQDIPVIMVDQEVSLSVLNIATKMAGPCMMYFDEFGKVFSKSARRELLPYFSDTSFKKVLFVVTSNGTKELDKFMIDRPGRFLFMIDYKKLDPMAISEMIDDFGLTGDMATMVNAYVNHHTVTFDMLRFLAPIAAECTDYLEFNDRIAILNCPPPIFPLFSVRKVIYKGQPFYGHYKLGVSEGKKYTLELREEGTTEAIHSTTFDSETRHQILEDNPLWRVRQIAVDDDTIVLGEFGWAGSKQGDVLSKLYDPAVKEEKKEERGVSMTELLHMPSMYREQLLGRAFRAEPEVDETQKELLRMAKFIVDNHKADEATETVAPVAETTE